MPSTIRYRLAVFIAVMALAPALTSANNCDLENREDGCSDPTDSNLYDNTFRKSCKLHDRCYATDGMGKSKCDDFFEKSMKSACEELSFVEEPVCKESARVFHSAVLFGGGSSYDGGQNWSATNCGTDDSWWSKIKRGHGHKINCPSGMIMAGRYHLSEATGFSQYFCTAVAASQSPGSWETVKKGDAFTCPDGQVLIGMEKKSKGKLGAQCATLSGASVGSPSWSDKISGKGKTYYCPQNKVLVGFKKKSNGIKYACSSVSV